MAVAVAKMTFNAAEHELEASRVMSESPMQPGCGLNGCIHQDIILTVRRFIGVSWLATRGLVDVYVFPTDEDYAQSAHRVCNHPYALVGPVSLEYGSDERLRNCAKPAPLTRSPVPVELPVHVVYKWYSRVNVWNLVASNSKSVR